MTYSPPNFIDVTTQSGVFSGATAMTPTSANLTGTGDPQLIDGANVTALVLQRPRRRARGSAAGWSTPTAKAAARCRGDRRRSVATPVRRPLRHRRLDDADGWQAVHDRRRRAGRPERAGGRRNTGGR